MSIAGDDEARSHKNMKIVYLSDDIGNRKTHPQINSATFADTTGKGGKQLKYTVVMTAAQINVILPCLTAP